MLLQFWKVKGTCYAPDICDFKQKFNSSNIKGLYITREDMWIPRKLIPLRNKIKDWLDLVLQKVFKFEVKTS